MKKHLLFLFREILLYGKNLKYAKPQDKINCLYNEKHPEAILNKVNELTGLDIKYYVKIDNKALIKLVDIIGGVEFEVPVDMNYDDRSQGLHIHLRKGWFNNGKRYYLNSEKYYQRVPRR